MLYTGHGRSARCQLGHHGLKARQQSDFGRPLSTLAYMLGGQRAITLPGRSYLRWQTNDDTAALYELAGDVKVPWSETQKGTDAIIYEPFRSAC